MKKKNCRVLWLGFDRALAQNLLKQLGVLAAVLLGALCLSYLFLAFSGSDWQNYCQCHDLSMWLLPVYLLIDSNALNNLYDGGHVHGWMLFASSLTFLFGALVFNGIIIGIITNSIERRVKNHQEGNIHYLKSGHYVIMGYDDMVPSIITHVFDNDEKGYVLLLSSMNAVELREKLSKSFDRKKMDRIIINYGHRTSSDAYKDIHLEAAEQVYVVGNHKKTAHDAINVECVDSICRYLERPDVKERPRRITCVFKDLDTYAAFKTSEIFKKVGALGMEFVPYNFFTGWAKQVFVKRKYRDFDNPGVEYDYPAVYGNGITPDDDRYVHLVFVGTTNFAVAFAMEAAHVLHFPNFNRDKRLRTRITFIDRNADKEKDEFIIRNRHFFEIQPFAYFDLTNEQEAHKEAQGVRSEYVEFTGDDAGFLDVEFEFIKGDVFSKAVQDVISKWADEHNDRQYLSLFLAQADQRQNFVMGMNMPDRVYDKAVPIFIRQDRSDNFVTNLRNADKRGTESKLAYSIVQGDLLVQEPRDARYANIYPFGMNETAYSDDEHSLRRAKLINYLYETANYDTYKFQSLQTLNTIPFKTIKDDANAFWKKEKFTVALKWSNLYSAFAIRTKLATLRAMRGLDLDVKSRDLDALSDYEVEQMAVVEHNRWNVEKLLMGYRKARNDEDKYKYERFAGELGQNKKLFIHHDIRPFKDLNIIRELDREFSRYIPWILKMAENNEW